jgi:hypothetical protein
MKVVGKDGRMRVFEDEFVQQRTEKLKPPGPATSARFAGAILTIYRGELTIMNSAQGDLQCLEDWDSLDI